MQQKVREELARLRREDSEIDESLTEKALRVYRRDGRIFLVVTETSDPLRIEVGVGRALARLLSEKYESVMPSRNMDDREWVEVICSGQLSDDEVIDLIRASWARAGVEIVAD